MSKKREILLKVCIFVLLFIFIYCTSYFINYIKYDNKKYIDSSSLVIDNQRLKKELLDINVVSYKDSIIAKVILRDMYSFYDELVLNVGREDGVEVNDAVLNEDGLIGVVTKANKNRCNVKLLSGKYNVSVKIGDTYGNFNNGVITMIDKYSEIRVGDKVYTSGLNQVAGNIYVGEVTDVFLDNDGLGKEAKVKLVDNRNLNYVFVIGKIE